MGFQKQVLACLNGLTARLNIQEQRHRDRVDYLTCKVNEARNRLAGVQKRQERARQETEAAALAIQQAHDQTLRELHVQTAAAFGHLNETGEQLAEEFARENAAVEKELRRWCEELDVFHQ